MSGIEGPKGNASILNELERLLRRESPLNAFEQLVSNLDGGNERESGFRRSVVCLDSNVLLNFSKRKDFEDVLDYFSAVHKVPLIISSQSLLEFWNNHISAVETVAGAVEKRFFDLRREVDKIDLEFGDFSARFKGLIDEFKKDFGHVHDRAQRRNLVELFTRLAAVARVYEVPRSRFYSYAAIRQGTKTPPGFKDSGDGDFFVWLDFLCGLACSKVDDNSLSSAIMVTDDRKSDWSKGGVPHPVLAAEVKAFVGMTFETWPLDRLAREVKIAISKVQIR